MFPYVYLVFSILAANNIYVSVAYPESLCCAKNQEYVNVTAVCPPTCEIRHPPCYIFPFVPIAGCQCKNGYILLSDQYKICVPINTCPETCCKPHTKFKECGSRCPISCQNLNPTVCAPICEPGCFCVEPYILDGFSLTCVHKKNCPK